MINEEITLDLLKSIPEMDTSKSIQVVREKLKGKAIDALRKSIDHIEKNELMTAFHFASLAKDYLAASRLNDNILHLKDQNND
jgi:hypothetical protein